MRAYRTYVVVEDSGQVTLSDMPFQAGERVEVVVIADDPTSATKLGTLQQLLHTTQTLPQARLLTDAEIAAEVAAVRTSQ
ncbi:MAG: hypothetical protein GDA68_17155 [Nitrospira sp. CR2.1]|nr:hypothetical protein [Nitrospira sp. CR2.1]MBA5873850.1 hypothetical protein [Nitrospira sp. CR1.2]